MWHEQYTLNNFTEFSDEACGSERPGNDNNESQYRRLNNYIEFSDDDREGTGNDNNVSETIHW